MRTVNIHEAKSQLSKLIKYALNGESTIIAKSGIPVAKLVPIHPEKPKRYPGLLKGKIRISEDFDDPLADDILQSFEGL